MDKGKLPALGKRGRGRMICKECLYYEPDYGTWGVFGWSGDGTKGYCCVEPKRVFVDGNRIKCRYFLSKVWKGE